MTELIECVSEVGIALEMRLFWVFDNGLPFCGFSRHLLISALIPRTHSKGVFMAGLSYPDVGTLLLAALCRSSPISSDGGFSRDFFGGCIDIVLHSYRQVYNP